MADDLLIDKLHPIESSVGQSWMMRGWVMERLVVVIGVSSDEKVRAS